MPRKAWVVVPNTPHHIVQRGHNRQVVFVERRDYYYYVQNLREWKEKLGCKLYAYCLMTNHIHLIVDPGDNPDNLALIDEARDGTTNSAGQLFRETNGKFMGGVL